MAHDELHSAHHDDVPPRATSPSESDEARSPYRSSGAPSHARVVFTRGASHVRIDTDPDLNGLFHAEFRGREPRVSERADRVLLEYGWSLWDIGRSSTHLVLDEHRAWSLESDGGLGHLEADLARARVRGVRIAGGASHVALRLGPPEETVRIVIAGGVSQFSLHRPEGVPVRVHLFGGASHVRLDAQELGAIGGELRWSTDGRATTTAAYELEVHGGVSGLVVASMG